MGSGLSSITRNGVQVSLQPPIMEAGAGGDPKVGTAPKTKGVWDPQRGVIRHNELINNTEGALGSLPSSEMGSGFPFSPPNGSRAGG